MKFTQNLGLTVGAIALLLPFAVSAHEIEGTLGVKAVVGATSTNSQGEVEVHSSTSASTSNERDNNNDEDMNDSERATSSDEHEVRGLENALIHVTANDAVHAEAVIKNLIEVKSEDDVAAFAKGKMKSDEHVEDVTVSTTTVGVKYRHPAKFLGFIPASILVTTTVDAQGQVHVTYPWYKFLLSAPTETKIRDSVSIPNVSGSTTLTVEQQAQIIDSLIAGLEKVRANLSASTTVSQ